MTKRHIWRGLAVAFAVAIIGIASTPWSLSGSSVRRQFGAQVHDATGLVLTDAGRVTFSLLPWPRVKVDSVRLEYPTMNGQTPPLVVETLNIRSDLRILPLLIGRIVVANLDVRTPVISLDPDGLQARAQSQVLAAPAGKPAGSLALDPPINPALLGSISAQSGKLRLAASKFGPATQFDDVQLRFDWRSLERPATFIGQAKSNNHSVNLSTWLGTPALLLSGGASTLSLKLTSDLAELSADGIISNSQMLGFDGKLLANSTDLSALLQTLQRHPDIPALPSKASLKAKTSITRNAIDMSDLQFSLGGSDFEGSLAVRTGAERPLISATLATDAINLGPLVDALPAVFGVEGASGETPLPKQFDLADLDIRVSAGRVLAGRLRLDEAALGAITNNGRIEFSIADSKVFGGSLKLRVSATGTADHDLLRASGAFSKINLKNALAAGGLGESFTGAATGQFTFESTGSTLNSILANLSGQTKIKITDGEIIGVDVEQALRRVEKKSTANGMEPRTGRMGFTLADGLVDVTGGVATLLDCTVNGPGAVLALSGQFGLLDRHLDLTAMARQSGDKDGTGPKLRIDLQGFFEDPHLTLEKPQTD